MKTTRAKKLTYIILVIIAAFFLWRLLRPINIFVIDEKFSRPLEVEIPQGLKSISAKECGSCHTEIYKEWSGTMHAMAWEDPYFQIDFVYDGSQQICLNCHTPLVNQQVALVLGFKDADKFKPILEPNPDYDTALRDEGVTCAVCHIKAGKIVGPFGTTSAPHPVVVDPLMTSGMKPCARCHLVSGARWDTFFKIPPCRTVAEIREGGKEPDCVGCHMPKVTRPLVKGGEMRKGRRHLFRGGHHPEKVRGALKVEYKKEIKRDGDMTSFVFTLTNTGAAHYLPTGTPDRHLTLEFRLLDATGALIKEKSYKMKRHILWRPFIVELEDTRLAYGEPRQFRFQFKDDGKTAKTLDVTVRYHLLEDKRRKQIGYENTEPIAYPIFNKRIPL